MLNDVGTPVAIYFAAQ